MAFVFKSENYTSYIPKNPNIKLGPGTYFQQPKDEPQSSQQMRLVQQAQLIRPFNATSIRFPDGNQKNKKETPGPGAYDLQGSFECQKVIFQSDEQEIKILEVPKPISVFRSTTVRFKDQKTFGPGPTHYQVEERRKFKSAETQKRKQNVLEQLFKENKCKNISIPSIPSGMHQYGYTENASNNHLEVNINEKFITSGDTIGPGAYEIRGQFDRLDKTRVRGVSWHQPSNLERKHEELIGPGSYDITNTSIPLYQMKPSTAFTSKCGRYTDFRFNTSQGKPNASYIKKGLDNKQYSFQLSTNDQTMRDSDEESQYSYIDDATPGPGYYENATTNHTIQSTVLKSKNKGQIKSQTKRFQKSKHYVPGPGEYKVDFNPKRVEGPHPPFMTKVSKHEANVSETPAPGHYKQVNTIEERLINKLMKAPLGSFGTNEPRFQQKLPAVPGPGAYEQHAQARPKRQKGTAPFKSEVERTEDLACNASVPPPGAYEIDQHTIANRVRKIEEEDPKLAVIKPPFGTGEERWKVGGIIDEEEEDEQGYQDKSPQSLYQKQAKNVPPFMSSEPRFNYDSVEPTPGPQEYADGSYPIWNKRTFNIIFAEI